MRTKRSDASAGAKTTRKPRKSKPALATASAVVEPSLNGETLDTQLCGRWVVEVLDIGLDTLGNPVDFPLVEIANDGEIHRRAGWAYARLTGKSVLDTHGAFELLAVNYGSRVITVRLMAGAQTGVAFSRHGKSGSLPDLGENLGAGILSRVDRTRIGVETQRMKEAATALALEVRSTHSRFI